MNFNFMRNNCIAIISARGESKRILKKYKIISWEALRTTFYKRVENEIIDVGVNVGVNVGINEILDFISKNSGLSAVQISQNLGVPLRTVQRQIKELKDKNYIEYKGSKKTGGYYAK